MMLWTAPPPGARALKMWALLKAPTISEELPMQTVTTIGLDIAKSIFQVHGVDAAGQVVTRASFPFPPRRKPMSRRLRFLLPFVLLAASMPPPAQAQSPVPDLEKEIRQRAAAIESKLIAWRRDIHEHPELGEQETRTSALVAAHLIGLGLEVKTGVGNTGVVGLLNDRIEVLCLKRHLGLLRYGRELWMVHPDVGHLMCDDQMMLVARAKRRGR